MIGCGIKIYPLRDCLKPWARVSLQGKIHCSSFGQLHAIEFHVTQSPLFEMQCMEVRLDG